MQNSSALYLLKLEQEELEARVCDPFLSPELIAEARADLALVLKSIKEIEDDED